MTSIDTYTLKKFLDGVFGPQYQISITQAAMSAGTDIAVYHNPTGLIVHHHLSDYSLTAAHDPTELFKYVASELKYKMEQMLTSIIAVSTHTTMPPAVLDEFKDTHIFKPKAKVKKLPKSMDELYQIMAQPVPKSQKPSPSSLHSKFEAVILEMEKEYLKKMTGEYLKESPFLAYLKDKKS